MTTSHNVISFLYHVERDEFGKELDKFLNTVEGVWNGCHFFHTARDFEPPFGSITDWNIRDVKIAGIDKYDGAREFNSLQLEKSRKQIEGLIGQLPVAYRFLLRKCGKDFNFLEAAYRRIPYPYWRLVVGMKMVYMLGMGIGRVKEIAPREFWDTLPGGVPYYIVEDDSEQTGGQGNEDTGQDARQER